MKGGAGLGVGGRAGSEMSGGARLEMGGGAGPEMSWGGRRKEMAAGKCLGGSR